jgi:hypothetical protein
MPYRLLTEFENLFSGKIYRHRSSTQGDFVAMHLYEDLASLPRQGKLLPRIQAAERVLATTNLRRGIQARRGDGTFGEPVPNTNVIFDEGYQVARVGPKKLATVEIGVEMKILNKAMIKQIDRVVGDLQKQIGQFQRGGGSPICVAVVGINHARYTVGFEGERQIRTDGTKHRHPYQEAHEAERRLIRDVKPYFDELILLRYSATNDPPYPFEWLNIQETQDDYGAALVRISANYDLRFP